MEKELKELGLALEESIEVARLNIELGERGRKSHLRLIIAKDSLRNKERELLEDIERNLKQ